MKRTAQLAVYLCLAIAIVTSACHTDYPVYAPDEPETGINSSSVANTADYDTLPFSPVPLAALPAAEALPQSQSGSDSSEQDVPNAQNIEKELLRLINEEREAQGVTKLETDDTMLWAGRIRSEELLKSFSHTRPDGTSYYTVFDEVDFSYAGKWHGENASYMYYRTSKFTEKRIAQMMFDDLKKSRGHHRNLLKEQYRYAGIGVYVKVIKGKTHITSSQLFASK
ncbi:MAG: CAP domain-containing protein [Oscillospiraceae bacterium]|nr:CAP domain-containing protein [Oscillospiraceae bacterium]